MSFTEAELTTVLEKHYPPAKAKRLIRHLRPLDLSDETVGAAFEWFDLGLLLSGPQVFVEWATETFLIDSDGNCQYLSTPDQRFFYMAEDGTLKEDLNSTKLLTALKPHVDKANAVLEEAYEQFLKCRAAGWKTKAELRRMNRSSPDTSDNVEEECINFAD